MNQKQQVGRWGERLAAEYLLKKGYQILGSNIRTAYGEIDLLANDGDEIVFVEVKTRTTGNYGLPEEAVTPTKREHLINSAVDYLESKNLGEVPWRIDVIAIRKLKTQPEPEIVHFIGAVNE